ncbi:chaperonin 10-like protein [Fusarium oxysporum f. sp. albedinis]|nr:chaperonin 10-like protein [Fusarium oxysporum f. sp. albedinis]
MSQQQSIPKTMKALRLVKFNENYQLRHDVPVPQPGPGEVLIHVAAASFCHTDYQVYQGTYGTQLPFTGSHEPAGTIASLGPGVPDDWKIGDRVGVLTFRKPCDDCAGCKWRRSNYGTLDARYCENKTMNGIVKSGGGFAEYMISSYYTLVSLPDDVSFEQAAPLMCAGATVWNAIKQTGLEKGQTIGLTGIGGLGVLGVQFAKALGYRVVASDNRDAGLKLASGVPEHLRPDLIVNSSDEDAAQKILDITNGEGLHGAVVCTDNLGLPDEGFRFDAFNLVFREINVKGSLHCSVDEVKKMIDAVSEHGIVSHLTILPLEEGEDIPERVAAHAFSGRLVVKIQ